MRKSDKLKNFKKINLIVENRYLESKGIISESFHDADGTPIGVDRDHMPIQENNENELKNLDREISNTLRDLLYGMNPMGYLNGEHVLTGEISPRQMNRRVDNVIQVLTNYTSYLKTNAKRSHDYGSEEYKNVWADREEGDVGLDEGEEIGDNFWENYNTSAQEQKQICWNMIQHFKDFDAAMNENQRMLRNAIDKGSEDEVKILNFRIQYMENNRGMLDTPENPFFNK